MAVNRRIRIMFVIDSLSGEAGTEKQLIRVIRGMDSQSFELFTACIDDGEPSRQLAPHATSLLFPLRSVFSFQGLRKIVRLRREINRLRIDIVHTFMIRATVLGVLAAYGSACKVVLTSRRNLGYWHTPWLRLVTRIVNMLTSRVVANSEAAKRTAIEIERLSPSRIDVLYNGVDLEKCSGDGDRSALDRLGVPRQSQIVGIVANYRPVKDLPTFLRAASLIAASCDDAVFLLVGHGTLRRSLGELAEQLGISGKVFFTDGEGSVAGYLPLMAMGCLSSTSEGFSNAILEYMAAGLAVVATDVGGNREAVVDGVTGFLTPVADEKTFARRVISLLEDNSLRKQMGERGRARCAECFTIEACIRRTESYYRSLLHGPIE
jgi:glycosyltransferase involved in cell wall biosynthesis